MPCFPKLLRPQSSGLFRGRALLLLLWLLPLVAWVRPGPRQQAQYQRRQPAQRFAHAYRDAPIDSLRRVLAAGRAPTPCACCSAEDEPDLRE